MRSNHSEIYAAPDSYAMVGPATCVTLAPYIEFSNGTKGYILVLNWNYNNPSVFLFNNEVRGINQPNVKYPTVTPSEREILKRYVDEYENAEVHDITNLKEAYEKYGVARLCGNFISAQIADKVCEYLNNDRRNVHFDTTRTKERIAGAHIQYTTWRLEDEILHHLDKLCEWERTILTEAMTGLLDDYDYAVWLHSVLITLRSAFADKLDKIGYPLGVNFGFQVATAYLMNNDTRWWRILERIVSMKTSDDDIKFSEHSFQEILAFYALSLYISKTRSFDQLVLDVCSVSLKNRVDLFSIYRDNVIKECWEDLKSIDNPELSAIPTKADAEIVAKARISELMGKTPSWLPEEFKKTYIQYEQTFCSSIGIGDIERENKKVPFYKETSGIKAVYEADLCKHKADWGAVFKILIERNIFTDKGYLAGAKFINDACDKIVTDKESIRQSPALSILGGKAEAGWTNRAPENRESNGKLLLYRKIAVVFFSAFK